MRKTVTRIARFTLSNFFREAADMQDAVFRKILPDMLIFTLFAIVGEALTTNTPYEVLAAPAGSPLDSWQFDTVPVAFWFTCTA